MSYQNGNYGNLTNRLISKKENEKIKINEIEINQIQLENNELNQVNNSSNKISLGINIGAFKTLYSMFLKINENFVTQVLLMNNSSRIIPSVICYTKSQSLFGESSFSSLKQNLSTSYCNLSRLINFENTNNYENELKYGYTNETNINNFKFHNYNSEGEKEEIISDYIIADYLSLINYYYFEKEKYEYTTTSLSVPDFYTKEQKEKLKIICESIGLKDIEIYNESSAITMYYGYIQYRDNFVENNKINTSIKKNVLLIDSGYSKTSFILSSFQYNEFNVKYVKCLPNIGGRNFDEKIFNYCIKESKFNKIEISERMKFRLYEEIRKKRIKLTVNDEINIEVESFYEDEDLEIVLKKNKFEELISDLIKEIDNSLIKIIDYAKNKNINIDFVEIADDLMRTPILQKIIEDKKIKISKTFLIDECASVGASILRTFYSGYFPIKYLEQFNNYKDKKRIIINNNIENKILKDNIINYIKQQRKKNEKYDNFINKKNDILKYYYKVRNKVENMNLNDNSLLNEMRNLDKQIRNCNNIEILNNINNRLENILKEINNISEVKEFEQYNKNGENIIKEKNKIDNNILKFENKNNEKNLINKNVIKVDKIKNNISNKIDKNEINLNDKKMKILKKEMINL